MKKSPTTPILAVALSASLLGGCDKRPEIVQVNEYVRNSFTETMKYADPSD